MKVVSFATRFSSFCLAFLMQLLKLKACGLITLESLRWLCFFQTKYSRIRIKHCGRLTSKLNCQCVSSDTILQVMTCGSP